MKIKRLLTSCFGLGLLPFAPGTWGSIPSAVIFALLCYFEVSAVAILMIMAVLVLAGSIVCVKYSPAIIAKTGRTDPGEIVADELAGQAAAFLPISFIVATVLSGNQIWIVIGANFLLFRFFDILKPWPIRKLEKLPAGWGILADDLLAGVYASVVLIVGCKFWILN